MPTIIKLQNLWNYEIKLQKVRQCTVPSFQPFIVKYYIPKQTKRHVNKLQFVSAIVL